MQRWDSVARINLNWFKFPVTLKIYRFIKRLQMVLEDSSVSQMFCPGFSELNIMDGF